MKRSQYPLIQRWQITNRIRGMADHIARTYGLDLPVFVIMMDGALPFANELLAWFPRAEKFAVTCKSYSAGEQSGQLRVDMANIQAKDVWARDVLVLDDICDSGKTLAAVKDRLLMLGAHDVGTCTLLHRTTKSKAPDFVGFGVGGDEFFVGFGMDYDGQYRDLPAIHTMEKE